MTSESPHDNVEVGRARAEPVHLLDECLNDLVGEVAFGLRDVPHAVDLGDGSGPVGYIPAEEGTSEKWGVLRFDLLSGHRIHLVRDPGALRKPAASRMTRGADVAVAVSAPLGVFPPVLPGLPLEVLDKLGTFAASTVVVGHLVQAI